MTTSDPLDGHDVRFSRAVCRATLVFAGLLAFASVGEAKDLCVNASSGSDAITYAANNGTDQCWASIGRAVWGSTDRGSPNSGEAAQAGDVVLVAGGTYSTSVSINDRWGVVYNPVNAGGSGNPITIRCTGTCILQAENANSPVIGANGRDHIHWDVEDLATDVWEIQACGLTTAPTGCTSPFVNTTGDTGPVVCHESTGCWVSGAHVDGGPPIDYTDNWNAFRYEGCITCRITNNRCESFHRAVGTNHNHSCVTLYQNTDTLIEHNHFSDAGAGVFFKDTGTTTLQDGNIVRFNWFTGIGECIAYSLTGEDRNYVYQNVCTQSSYGVRVVGGTGTPGTGNTNDWVFNNTFYDIALGCFSTNAASLGMRFWGNVCVDATTMLIADSTTWPADTLTDNEHNLYFTYTTFYSGSDGTRTFASFVGAYADQEQATPSSLNAQDPLFVDAATEDFRLCTGSGTPAAGCSGASPALALSVDMHDLDGDGSTTDTIPAGAYITGTEVIGINAAGQEPGAPTIRYRLRQRLRGGV